MIMTIICMTVINKKENILRIIILWFDFDYYYYYYGGSSDYDREWLEPFHTHNNNITVIIKIDIITMSIVKMILKY